MSRPVPKLLVSVRDGEEARAALAGGVDILDIKNPARGSLGMADLSIMQQIAAVAGEMTKAPPLSAALGEVLDWPVKRAAISLPASIHWAKLGLSGLANRSDWAQEWLSVRQRIDAASGTAKRWIAVAYADETTAQSPPLSLVIEQAAKTGCDGVLIDTFSKQQGTLLDLLTPQDLHQVAESCRESQLFLAVAGRLSASDLAALKGVGATLVAVRSAVCAGADRQQAVTTAAVQKFREVLVQTMETGDRRQTNQGACAVTAFPLGEG